jgi:hypothetical protein
LEILEASTVLNFWRYELWDIRWSDTWELRS